MKVSLFLAVLVGLTSILNASKQTKRTAYDPPDGAQLIVDRVQSSFVCSNDGYYADQENNCQIFHVCHSVMNTDGTSEMLQWSFLCINQTIFNQFSFTCAHPEDSIPCESASDFFNLNAIIGVPRLPFHFEKDIAKTEAIRVRPVSEIPGFTAGEASGEYISEVKNAPLGSNESGRPSPPPTRPPKMYGTEYRQEYRGVYRIKGGQYIYKGGRGSGGTVKGGYEGIHAYEVKKAPLGSNESGRPPPVATRPPKLYDTEDIQEYRGGYQGEYGGYRIKGGQDIYKGGRGSGGAVKGGHKGIFSTYS